MSFLLGTLLHSFRESVLKMLLSFKGLLYKFIAFTLTSTVVVWLSVFLYGTFYYTYMPAVSHVKPLHFNFRSCANINGPCSYPSANLTLVKKGHEHLLMRGQQYKVYVNLELPESPKNQEVGMFMIKIDFYARKGEIVDSSARTAMLRYKSPLLNTMSTLFFAPLMFAGSIEEKQILSVELFDYYEEDPRKPAVGAFIQIQSSSVQLYSASLHIFAHFTGLRYLMFHWPLLSSIVGIGTVLFFLTVIALLSWYRYALSSNTNHVVVRVGYDTEQKIIDQRRKHARDKLIKERIRQTSLSNSDVQKRERPGFPHALGRAHSLESLVRVQDIMPRPSQLATRDKRNDDDSDKSTCSSTFEDIMSSAEIKERSPSDESKYGSSKTRTSDEETILRQRTVPGIE